MQVWYGLAWISLVVLFFLTPCILGESKSQNQNHKEQMYRVFVIHCESDHTRKREFERRVITEPNLKWEFTPCVDGRVWDNLTLKELGDQRLIQRESTLRPTEAALFMSHINIWKKAQEEDLPFVVVLEDDALIMPGFTKRLQKCLRMIEQAADPWSIFYLFHNNTRPYQKTLYNQVDDRTQLYRIQGVSMPGTVAYVLPRATVKYFLSKVFPLNDKPIDIWLDFQLSYLNQTKWVLNDNGVLLRKGESGSPLIHTPRHTPEQSTLNFQAPTISELLK